MSTAKIAISIEENILEKLDGYIARHAFKNRSQAIQLAVSNIIDKLEHKRLRVECSKLNPNYEKELAEEWLDGETELWEK